MAAVAEPPAVPHVRAAPGPRADRGPDVRLAPVPGGVVRQVVLVSGPNSPADLDALEPLDVGADRDRVAEQVPGLGRGHDRAAR